MNRTNYTIKDYRNDIKEIYKIKDISQFKQRIAKLYANKKINQSLKITQLKKLLVGNKNLIDTISLIVCNILSALITTTIKLDGINEVLSKGIDEIVSSLVGVFLTFFIVEVITVSITLILIVPFVTSMISSKDIERNNIEIKEIIKTTNKASLSALLEKEKESKKMLAFRLILSVISGVSIPLIATIIVSFVG